MQVTIRHNDTAGAQRLAVTLVTVGDQEAPEQKFTLAPQEQVTVEVHTGQFLLVDEKDEAS